MRKMMVMLLAVSTVGAAGAAHAQDYSPTSSYANPDGTTERMTKQRGPCQDPWVTMALTRVFGRADASKCTVSLYNNGSWSSYNELIHAVGATAPKTARWVNPYLYEVYLNGRLFSVLLKGNFYLVGNDGASLIGNDGSTFSLQKVRNLSVADLAKSMSDVAKLIGNDSAGLISNKAMLVNQAGLMGRLISNKPVYLEPRAGMRGLQSGTRTFSEIQSASNGR